jgi:glutaredoxin-related protein
MSEVKFLNFEVVELTGATKEDAFNKAPFFISGDATQSYKKWEEKQEGVITDAMKREFFISYLKKKNNMAPGAGFAITVQSAVKDSRQRPYTFHDVKNEKGARKWKKTYEIKDDVTKEVIGATQDTKAKAKEIAKELFKNGLKHNITCTYTKQVVNGEPVAFKAEYTPSKSSQPGKYIAFGIKA